MNTHLPYLQLLRGLSALGVMTVHSHYNTPLGGVGVDMFFVLSGFIMLHIHTHKPKTSWWQFMLKRVWRIYPMYWLIAGSYLLLHYCLGNLHDFYTGNFWGYLQSFLLTPYHPHIILPSWSLPFELLFYLFFGCWLFLPQARYSFGVGRQVVG